MAGCQGEFDRDQRGKRAAMLSSNQLTGEDRGETRGVSNAAQDSSNVVLLGRIEQAEIGRRLREFYDCIEAEPLPAEVLDALALLEEKLLTIDQE